MRYNIVPLIDKWLGYDLLQNIPTGRDQLALARLLEKANKYITQEMMNGRDVEDVVISTYFACISELYHTIYISKTRQISVIGNAVKKLIAKNHKIDYISVLDILADVSHTHSEEELQLSLGFVLYDYEEEIKNMSIDMYIIKHGK